MLSTIEILHQKKNSSFKKKIALLGGIENYKDKFQEVMSSKSLPIDNKQNIGVNISKIDYSYKNDFKFEYFLWNIDCRLRRAYFRKIFYCGAEAIVILISETKLDQIIQYYNEIHNQLQYVNLVFCIILENSTHEIIRNKYFKNGDLKILFESTNFQLCNITKPSTIINQISSIFIRKLKYKELENSYLIDFIQRDLLFPQSDIKDECIDYFEPQNIDLRINYIINTEKLIKYILKMDLDITLDPFNWIKIKNGTFGTFSIFLKNGNVYYFPKICENCKNKKCSKLKNAPFFICIEAESQSWTNIKGFDQPELLMLSKILALKDGTERTLPMSVLKQIIPINECEKKRKKK